MNLYWIFWMIRLWQWAQKKEKMTFVGDSFKTLAPLNHSTEENWKIISEIANDKTLAYSTKKDKISKLAKKWKLPMTNWYRYNS